MAIHQITETQRLPVVAIAKLEMYRIRWNPSIGAEDKVGLALF